MNYQDIKAGDLIILNGECVLILDVFIHHYSFKRAAHILYLDEHQELDWQYLEELEKDDEDWFPIECQAVSSE